MHGDFTQNENYRSDVDGLRGLAILSVVLFHFYPNLFRGGYLGVDVFFVISGYLISTIITREIDNQSFCLPDFYSRRAVRILPALLLVLSACLVAGWFFLLPREYIQLGNHTRAGSFFFSNFLLWSEVDYFDPIARWKPLRHLWSLAVEEQFYLVWPLVLLMFKNKSKWRAKIILLFFLLSLAFRFGQRDLVAGFYSPFSRIWELAVGSLLAISQPIQKRSYRAISPWIGSFLIVGAFTFGDELQLAPTIAVVAGTAMLLASRGSELNSRFLGHPLLVSLGIISFPLYLWHWPLLVFFKMQNGNVDSIKRAVVVMGISLLLAWSTFRYIEVPLRFGIAKKRVAIVLGVLTIALGGVGSLIQKYTGLPNRKIVLDDQRRYTTISFNSNPPSNCSPNLPPSVQCSLYSSAGAENVVVVWGDSMAAAWSPVFRHVAHAKKTSLVVIHNDSCPPIFNVREWPENSGHCNFVVKESIRRYIHDLKPHAVFLVSAWQSYNQKTSHPLTHAILTDESNGIGDSETTEKAIANQLPVTIKDLRKESRVIVFKPWPLFNDNPQYPAKQLPFLSHDLQKLPIKAHRTETSFIATVFEKMDSNTEFFDPAEKICTDECPSYFQRIKLYEDAFHISPSATMLYENEIQDLFLGQKSAPQLAMRRTRNAAP